MEMVYILIFINYVFTIIMTLKTSPAVILKRGINMNITFLEPLGVSQKKLESIFTEKVSSKYNFGDELNLTFYDSRTENLDDLISRSRDSHILVLSNIKFPKEVISQCKNLKMICVAFTGYDHIDIKYCQENNIAVYNCSGYSDASVSELVFAMAINLMRNIIPCQQRLLDGKTKEGLVGFQLEGKTFGILGMGAIGSRVATIASAFGCNVIYYSRSKKSIENCQYVTFEDLLKKSDILSIHLPQNEDTINMISTKELAIMKPSSIIINTARGPIVDYKALKASLNSDRIAGAGIDVFNVEPPIVDDVILEAKNTLLTPHIAFASHQSFEKRANILCENIIGFLEGSSSNKIV